MGLVFAFPFACFFEYKKMVFSLKPTTILVLAE